MATTALEHKTDRGAIPTANRVPAPVVGGVRIPTHEEWQVRAERVIRRMEQWEVAPLSDDVATFEEICEAVERNPVLIRESAAGG